MPWIAGQRLQNGKYVIEQVLGQGGFGITYKALQVELNRPVVIKTPNEFLSHDPEYDRYVERFIGEGQTLARLSQDPHPHIVGVIDLFREGATHCLVMDFVPGENLFEAVKRRGALPEAEILPCIRQIGEALTVVHQAGLVHRDAHPGNIMLRRNGRAVLIDFGIAKGIEPQTLSSTGNVGNRGFAPYEQMTRGSREPTVDIYCLAATLYYAMTGQPPTTSLARKLDDAPLIPPKQHNRTISEQLNQAILKGMALEANNRPQSMQAWLAMLEAPKVSEPPIQKVASLPLVEPSYRKLASIGILPPSIEPVHRKEVFRPQIKPSSEVIRGQPSNESPGPIPWIPMATVLSCYALIDCLLAVFNTPSWAWAWAWVIAMAWAWAVVWAWALALSMISSLTLVLIVMLIGFLVSSTSIPVAAIVALCVVLAVSSIVAWAGSRIEKSFSKFYTFLILAGISCLGLSLEVINKSL